MAVLLLVCGALAAGAVYASTSTSVLVPGPGVVSNASDVYHSMFGDASIPYSNYQTERIYDPQSSVPENRVSVL